MPNHSLPRPSASPEVIIDHQRCVHCDYDLNGLKTLDRCPECGTPIRPARKHTSSIADAPQSYLRELELGALALGAGLTLGALWWLGVVHVGFLRLMIAWSLLAGLASALWAWGVHRVSAPRRPAPGERTDTRLEWRSIRLVSRATQWLWPLAAGSLFLAATLHTASLRAAKAAIAAGQTAPATLAPFAAAPAPAPSSHLVFVLVALVLAIAGLLGLLAFLLLAANLAQWAQDYDLEKRLRAAPLMLLVSIPMLGLYTLLMPYLWGRWIPVFSWPAMAIVGGLLLLCLWFVVAPLVQFVALCHWARRNARAASTRDRRASARIVQRIEEGRARPEPMPVTPRRPPPRPQGNYLAPGAGGAIDLADNPAPPPGPAP